MATESYFVLKLGNVAPPTHGTILSPANIPVYPGVVILLKCVTTVESLTTSSFSNNSSVNVHKYTNNTSDYK